jgi:hypothetical protein
MRVRLFKAYSLIWRRIVNIIMVSIIISSVSPAQLQQVTGNITETIGVPFEIIAIDNRTGKQGICAVYNQGAEKANYPILCFMHQDVVIKTNNWGKVLHDIFERDGQIGLVGIAGSAYKSLSPSPWGGHAIDTKYMNFEQYYKFKQAPPELMYRNPGNVKLAQVACVDGVFMCTTKTVFANCQFDAGIFKGFHLYDIDFSLAVGSRYKVMVTYDIFLSHLSEGRYDKNWMQDNITLHEKWNAALPVNIEGLNMQQQQKVEKISFKDFINKLMVFNMPLSIAYKLLKKNNRFKTLYGTLFWKLNFYLLKLKLFSKG